MSILLPLNRPNPPLHHQFTYFTTPLSSRPLTRETLSSRPFQLSPLSQKSFPSPPQLISFLTGIAKLSSAKAVSNGSTNADAPPLPFRSMPPDHITVAFYLPSNHYGPIQIYTRVSIRIPYKKSTICPGYFHGR